MADLFAKPSILDTDFLSDLGERICQGYNCCTGSQITSNIDHIEGLNFVEEIMPVLGGLLTERQMLHFYEKVSFCQESQWHTDTFCYSVVLVLKADGHVVENKKGESCTPNVGDVIFLRSDIRHRLVRNEAHTPFVFVAFDLVCPTDANHAEAMAIFDNLTTNYEDDRAGDPIEEGGPSCANWGPPHPSEMIIPR